MATIHPDRTPVGKAILKRLRTAPATVREVAEAIGLNIRRVAPVATMLAEMGAISPTGECHGVGCRQARVWEVCTGE